MKLSLFKRQPAIMDSIDKFLDTLHETSHLFHEGLQAYVIKNKAEFAVKMQMIIKHEHDADHLRRDIGARIYRKNLIPESSSDVLALLEKIDNIINQIGFVTNLFDIEEPYIPDEFYHQFERIAYTGMQCTEALVHSARNFFKNMPATMDTLDKVSFWETEGDKAILMLQRMIFKSELSLAEKLHLKELANAINSVSDTAEDAAEMLQIYVIKHSY